MSKHSENSIKTRNEESIEPFLMFDENLDCVGSNTAMQCLCGVSEENLIGKNIQEIIPNIQESGVYSECQMILKEGDSRVLNSDLFNQVFIIKVFKVGKGLGVLLSPASNNGISGGDDNEQRIQVAGRLAALTEVVQGLSKELSMLANEHGAFETINTSVTSNNGEPIELSGEARESSKGIPQTKNANNISDLQEAYLDVAKTLATMVELREPYARGHSERVSQLANDIAVWLGCTPEEAKEVQIAAIVHDVGKIVIPDYILFKPGELTLAEYNEVKRHPTAAVELLKNLSHFNNLMPIIEGHHEWYNGNGYPKKLKDNDIHIGARIIAVADAYDAMTSPRPHRSRFSSEEAIEIITAGAGTQWDPMIVYAFLEVLGADYKDIPVGTKDLDMIEKAFRDRKAAGPLVEEKMVVGDERRVMVGAPKEKRETLDRAAEALERARHWAAWLESAEREENELKKAKEEEEERNKWS